MIILKRGISISYLFYFYFLFFSFMKCQVCCYGEKEGEGGWGWCIVVWGLWLSYGLPPFSAFALLPCFQHSHHPHTRWQISKKVTHFLFLSFHSLFLSSRHYYGIYLSLSACKAKPRSRYSYLEWSFLKMSQFINAPFILKIKINLNFIKKYILVLNFSLLKLGRF